MESSPPKPPAQSTKKLRFLRGLLAWGKDSNLRRWWQPGRQLNSRFESDAPTTCDRSERSLAFSDSLDHRHVDIGICVHDRPTVGCAKTLDCEKGTAIVAVGQGMVPREALDQCGGLLDQGRIGVVIAEARLRNGECRLSEGDAREPRDLLRRRPENLGGDQTVIAELEVIDLGYRRRPKLLRQSAQGLGVLLHCCAEIALLLLGSSRQAGFELGLSWPPRLLRG